MRNAILLVAHGFLSLRAVVFVFRLFQPALPVGIPSHETVRNWMYRIALFAIQQAAQPRSDWIFLIDHTVQLGRTKCLVILGVSYAHLVEVGFCLQHADLVVLDVHPMDSSTGDLISDRLTELTQKTGTPLQIVRDGGSDLCKGIDKYQKTQPEVIDTYDISHGLACSVKAVLEKDARWAEFRGQCSSTRQRLQQTSGSVLCPPAERTKGRYMNIAPYVEWARKTLTRLEQCSNAQWSACLDLPETSARAWVEERVGWLRDFAADLAVWEEIVAVVETTEKVVKTEGLGRTSYEDVHKALESQGLPQSSDPRLQKVHTAALEHAAEEGAKIPEGKQYLGSTDVEESLFGKYKSQEQRSPFGEIGLMVLLIPLMVMRLSTELIQQALATVKWSDVEAWQEANLEPSRLKKGRILDGKASIKEAEPQEVERGPPEEARPSELKVA